MGTSLSSTMPTRARRATFPLPDDFFPPVHLTDDQIAGYEAVAHERLREVVQMYAESQEHCHTDMPAPWKFVGSVGRLRSYKMPSKPKQLQRMHSQDCVPRAGGKLGCGFAITGMIQGSYEDVMGVHYTDNTGDWLNLQKLLFPSTVDAAVIHTIRASGGEDSLAPLGYLGIKWAAYRSSPLATVRDCCVLEMVGYTKDHHGRDLGYSISFSLDLPECPEVVQNDKHFMRMRHFSATLMAECRDVDSTTEIFVVGSNEMLGTQGSNALCRLYMTVLNDFSLVIDSRNILKQTCVRRSDWVEDHERSECVLCERSFKLSSFRRRHHCRLCGEVVCARCLVTRTVPNVIMGTKVKLKKSKFCVRCVVNVRQVEVKCETYADRVQKANRMRLNGRHSSIASSMSSSISASLPTGVSLLSSSSFSEAEPNPANDNSGQRESSLTYHRRVSRPLLKISSINEKSVLLDDHDFIDMDDVDLRLSKSNASRTPKDTSTAKDDAGRAASSGSTTSTASTGRSSLSRKDSFQSLSDFYSTLRRLSQPDPVAP